MNDREHMKSVATKLFNDDSDKYNDKADLNKLYQLLIDNKENAFLPDNLSELPTRILTQIMDLGTLDPNVSVTENADPSEYQSQSLMRYNSLLTQSLSIVVPSNTNLKAGDIIMCKFPKITRQNVDSYDDQQSGLYMIKELCHHFDTTGSFTSMTLVRDTFGKYGTNTQEP